MLKVYAVFQKNECTKTCRNYTNAIIIHLNNWQIQKCYFVLELAINSHNKTVNFVDQSAGRII